MFLSFYFNQQESYRNGRNSNELKNITRIRIKSIKSSNFKKLRISDPQFFFFLIITSIKIKNFILLNKVLLKQKYFIIFVLKEESCETVDVYLLVGINFTLFTFRSKKSYYMYKKKKIFFDIYDLNYLLQRDVEIISLKNIVSSTGNGKLCNKHVRCSRDRTIPWSLCISS